MRIAVFDSGIGGITVLKELRARFPSHDFFYYGDTANVPYGTKSRIHIKELVKAAATEIKKKKVDAMVIACNTAAAIALEECKEVMATIPVYSVVEAGIATISRMLQTHPEKPVVIFGTKATVRSKTYSTSLREKLGESIAIHEQACPLLVPMIEEGWVDHPILQQTVEEYVRPFLSLPPGIAFLACTHYPWIEKVFEHLMPNWKVIDSAKLVGEMLDAPTKISSAKLPHGTIEWNFTDPDAAPIPSFAKII